MMNEYINLLVKIINTPSLSGNEMDVANLIRHFLESKDIIFSTKDNNTWSRNKHWSNSKPVILLHSHIDTVSPVTGWTDNPYEAKIIGDKLIGLGSNDAGGALVTLLAVYIHLYDQSNLPYNLIFAASAEEENSGSLGILNLINELGKIDLAIVGEPTSMELAVAEKGLLVLDCTSIGKAAHAAHDVGVNAIYQAMNDINVIKNLSLPLVSPILGPVKFTVTQINSGHQHNIIPDRCSFVVDIRTNEYYSNSAILSTITQACKSNIKARSLKHNSKCISLDHPVVQRAKELNIKLFGSSTMSDQSMIPYPSVKIGPGDSARSHTANEFILISEIIQGFSKYLKILENLKLMNV